jgi:hypothetical protein
VVPFSIAVSGLGILQEVSMGSVARTTRSGDRWTIQECRRAALLLCLLLYVASCALWIEVLNGLSGTPLPRDSSTDGPNRKWRIAASIHDDPAMSLTEKQRRVSEQRLREVVGTCGMLQYLLGPMTVLLGAIGVASRRNRTGIRQLSAMAIIVGLLALFSACGRQYWSSLGW